MSSEYIYVKIVKYLTNLKTEYIMAASVIYQRLEDNPWISKDELRDIAERTIWEDYSNNVKVNYYFFLLKKHSGSSLNPLLARKGISCTVWGIYAINKCFVSMWLI